MNPTTNLWNTPAPSYAGGQINSLGGVNGVYGPALPANNANNTSYPGNVVPTAPTPAPTPSTSTSGGTAPNPQTTYINYNGENKKLADWMGQGILDANGNPINKGPSASDIDNQINSMYGPTMDILNQNVGLIQGQKTSAEQQAAADLAANQSMLGTQKESVLGQLGTQARGVQTQKEDALAQARRLYGELQRGNVQRFGGATSAGQAASEIQGAEAQRQFGQTGRSANEAFQKIEQAKTDVENQYKTGLLQLQQQHQQGMAKIQNDFTNAIMQINNQRAATEQAKGQAKLQALENLRTQALALTQQQTTFQQQLEAMKYQADLNIQQYAKTAGAAANTGNAAQTAFNTQTSTLNPYSTVGQGQSTQQAQPTGPIAQTGKSWWDQLMGGLTQTTQPTGYNGRM